MEDADDDKGFTIVMPGFASGEAEVGADVLRAAGLDARVIESASADYLEGGVTSDLRDVIVPADQAEAALAIIGIAPVEESEPEPYRPAPLQAVMPLIWIGALLLAAAIILPSIAVIRAGDLNAVSDTGWIGAGIGVVVGLLLIVGPLLSSMNKRDPGTARPRSRIVS